MTAAGRLFFKMMISKYPPDGQRLTCNPSMVLYAAGQHLGYLNLWLHGPS